MICLTGTPGSGKTTVAGILRNRGYKIANVLDLKEVWDCISGEEVDIDCVRDVIERCPSPPDILEGHYSHLLQCSYVIIIERDEASIERELEKRGYARMKIQENLDAQRSDLFYTESLDYLPRGRIFRVRSTEGDIQKTVSHVMGILDEIGKDRGKSL